MLIALFVSTMLVVSQAGRSNGRGGTTIAALMAGWHLGATWWVVRAVHAGGDWTLLWQGIVLVPMLVVQVAWFWVVWAGLSWLARPASDRQEAVARNALVWCLSFCAADVLRQQGWSGDPYGSLGVTLVDAPGVSALLPLIGAQGVTWAAMAACCALTAIVLQARQARGIRALPNMRLRIGCVLASAVCGVVVVASNGHAFTTPSEVAPLHITAVQPLVVGRGRWSAQVRDNALDRLREAMAEAPANGLVVTPESYLYEPPPAQPTGVWADLLAQVESSGANLLLGMPYLAAETTATGDMDEANATVVSDALPARHMNAVVQLSAQRGGVYAKERLAPGAEYLPLEDWLAPLYQRALGHRGHSEQPAPLQLTAPLYVAGAELGLSICHELAFGSTMARRARFAGVLVNVSLDGWIPSQSFRRQMRDIARVRAMEMQKPLIRVTDNGGSMHIDLFGRIVPPAARNAGLRGQRMQSRSETPADTVVFAGVQPRDGQTPYARWARLLEFAPLTGVVAIGLRRLQQGGAWRRKGLA